MKGIPGLIGVLWLALAAWPAGAATLYRCVGDDGVANFTNTRVAGSRCQVATRYTPERGRPAAAPARAAAPAASPVPASAASSPAPGAASAGGQAPGLRVSSAPMPPGPHRPGGAPVRRVNGQVYSYMKDGVRHFSSRPPAAGTAQELRTIAYSFIETCYACAVQPGVSFATVRLNTDAYREEIAAAAREFGVEEAIVRAIIHAESAYNPMAVSRAGAQGLMQLMPAPARRFGVSDSFDVAQNIRGGVQYLAWLLRRFNGDLTLAAAGYNAGEGAVDRYGGGPPYSETQRYVQRVGMLAERYRGVQAAR